MPDIIQITRFRTALAHWPHFFTQFSTLVSGINSPGFHQNPEPWKDQLDDLARTFLASGNNSHQGPHPGLDLGIIMEMISFLNEQVTCRIIQHAMVSLEKSDHLAPPCPFCWINMGSDARREQVVRTDQDNGLIFADPPFGEAVKTDHYFLSLAERIVTGLDRFGFRRCSGNVMATNPVWRRSLGGWLKALDQWVGSTQTQKIRQLTILLDFRAVYGDKRLARVVQSRVFDLFHQHPSVSHFLAQDDRVFPSPKTLFGRIRTQKDRKRKNKAVYFNLKTRGIVHLINGARILALNHRIQIPSTLTRLQLLGEEKVLSPGETQQYTAAFNQLVRMKLENHLNGQNKKNLPIHCIDVSTLDLNDYQKLTHSLDAVIRLQKRIHRTYNQAWMNFFR
jgi:CBS domain-containing protein